MGATRRPAIGYIERTRAQYSALGHPPYRWVERDSPPLAPLDKPLSQCRVGLIATGGVYGHGQTAFTHRDDCTYRAIPADTGDESLSVTHFAYDLTSAREDIGVVFPLASLRRMRDRGVIGSLAPNVYGCMGGIYSTRRVESELAPALLARCRRDEVDAVLLVPV